MLRRWRQPAIQELVKTLDFCNVLDYVQPWLSGIGLILMFHRIVEPGSQVFDQSLVVDTGSLDRILRYIRSRDWDIISADQLHENLTSGWRKRSFVCCTFDDGYADNLTLALPIFQRHSAPFSINVAVGYVNRTAPAWWDALAEMLQSRDEIEFYEYGKIQRLRVATWDEKCGAYYRFRAIFHRDVDEGRTPFEHTWALNNVDPRALTDHLFLSWEQLAELAKHPLVQIGAHTVTHPSLPQLSENEAGDEIERSKRILEERLGVQVAHFAYPFGNSGAREFRLARELKFKTAVTTKWCNVFPAHKLHQSSLPRKFLMQNDIPETTMRARMYEEDLALKPWKRVVV